MLPIYQIVLIVSVISIISLFHFWFWITKLRNNELSKKYLNFEYSNLYFKQNKFKTRNLRILFYIAVMIIFPILCIIFALFLDIPFSWKLKYAKIPYEEFYNSKKAITLIIAVAISLITEIIIGLFIYLEIRKWKFHIEKSKSREFNFVKMHLEKEIDIFDLKIYSKEKYFNNETWNNLLDLTLLKMKTNNSKEFTLLQICKIFKYIDKMEDKNIILYFKDEIISCDVLAKNTYNYFISK